MDEKELRKHRCCFTGHRPEKLAIPERQMAKLLEMEIRKAIDKQFITFISGMARGTDIVAAEIVLRLRAQDERLKLICALPHPGFGLHWGGGWTKVYWHRRIWRGPSAPASPMRPIRPEMNGCAAMSGW